jgi:hypothetical protein
MHQNATVSRHVSYNPELHDRMKHVARRHFFVRDMVENFEINVPFVPTKKKVGGCLSRTPFAHSACDV